ncbi:hypothetical protein [Gluconacetobacter azotocaptans]|nr:hypothetical protein [Gluconacetobacter azotocaptans]GBQ32217.1 hypothetical protein AA13594_2304 [Gluconacetobacter azotocaptans DSM 13594]
MGDQRWRVLPLGARAAWLELCDLADALPHIRAPASARVATIEEIARLLAADIADITPAVTALVAIGVMETYRDGYRLRAY